MNTHRRLIVTAVLFTAVGATAHALSAPAPALAQARPVMPPAGTMPARPATLTPPGGPAAPSGSPSALPSIPSGTPIPSDYIIGPGDVLQVTVWKNETLSRVAPVRPDGKISMPLLHDIQAAGLTTMQLRDKIATALGEYLPNPEVSVSVNEVRSLRISVLGEVQKPGVLELRGKTTILEAIAMAGGFRDFASPSKITVIRTDDGGQTTRIRFNYNRAASGDEPNLVLRPGDVVIVP
jgi:polysaccharide export outer membrane protein